MLTTKSRIGELLHNPIGRDLIGRLVQYAGLDEHLLKNPLLRVVPFSVLPRLAGGLLDGELLGELLALCNQCEGEPLPVGSDAHCWWKEAVIYQVYPRSFCDSNGDGVGDLPGLIGKLPYLASLGVTALWLSPVFDSPNDDNGYDVRDYRKVLAEFGTMADMDRLIAEAHARGIRIVLDMVLNHTSDEHEWYRRALENEPPYRDYYIFREGTENEPPNNWRSFFSGSAWKYEPQRKAWALHLFSRKQMDLNWEEPAVRADVCDIVRFWRERGVDGFRLDVINLISKTSLKNGSETVGSLLGTTGIEQYFYGENLHPYLRQLRTEGLGDAFAVGETPGTGPEMNKLLTAPSRGELDLVFCFDHLDALGKSRFDDYRYDLNHLKRCFLAYQGEYADTAWPSIFVENHDNPRMLSKIDPALTHRQQVSKLLAVLLLTARGTVFLYQGQELGAANVAFESIAELRDVEAINRYRELCEQGKDEASAFAAVLSGARDHARVPMAWNGSANGGFTEGTPWIRMGDPRRCNVEEELRDADSVLSFYRVLIALRKAIPTLVYGRFVPVDPKRRDVFCYYRTDEQGTYYVEANLSDRPQRRAQDVNGMQLLAGNYAGRDVRLRPFEAALYRC